MTEIWVVDAFASAPFTGNSAGVCVLPAFPEAGVMQRIAMEMNHAETAFLVKAAPLDYHLRWFTPAVEVSLCGHATLAATHMLHESGAVRAGDKVKYRTQSGDLHASVKTDGIELDFPSLPGSPVDAPATLDALGLEFIACEKNRDNYLVEVRDYDALMACKPDFRTLAALDILGVIITTADGVQGFDFASRYFAPGAGIDEDPVTGSAHCFLAPYWAKKLNRQQFHAVQASKRSGVLDVTLSKDRVLIAGKAVTTLKGKLQVNLLSMEKAA